MRIPKEFYENMPKRMYYSFEEYKQAFPIHTVEDYDLMRRQYAMDLDRFYKAEKLIKPVFAAIPIELWEIISTLTVHYPAIEEQTNEYK